MIAILTFFILAASLAGGFALLGALALQFGVDSRPGIGDDHAR